MANPEKGEVAFQHNGKTYTLVSNIRSSAMLQRLFNTTDRKGKVVPGDLIEIERLMKAGSVEHVVANLWAMLQKFHAAEFPTVDQAYDLMDDAGSVVTAAFYEAIGAGAIDPKDLDELVKAAREGNPQEAAAKLLKRRNKGSTGAPSTSRRVPAA